MRFDTAKVEEDELASQGPGDTYLWDSVMNCGADVYTFPGWTEKMTLHDNGTFSHVIRDDDCALYEVNMTLSWVGDVFAVSGGDSYCKPEYCELTQVIKKNGSAYSSAPPAGTLCKNFWPVTPYPPGSVGLTKTGNYLINDKNGCYSEFTLQQ